MVAEPVSSDVFCSMLFGTTSTDGAAGAADGVVAGVVVAGVAGVAGVVVVVAGLVGGGPGEGFGVGGAPDPMKRLLLLIGFRACVPPVLGEDGIYTPLGASRVCLCG